MDAPQLTMESVEVSSGEHSEDVEIAMPPQRATRSGSTVVVVDEDENDDVGESGARPQQQPRIIDAPFSSQCLPSAPVSSQSLPSVQSSDQVLGLDDRLDCTDSNALFSRISEQQQRRSSHQQGGQQRNPSPHRRLSTRTSSFRQSASKLTRPSFSRRPSMHETHDSEPLMRGEFLYYLYSFAILGTSFRMFMARFFGQDCEMPGSVSDFMSPLTETICVTSSGTTMQHGGALFLGELKCCRIYDSLQTSQ